MQNPTGIFSIWESDDPGRRVLGPNMQNPTGNFSIWEPDDPSRRILAFGPKSDDLGHQIFKSKNIMLSKFKMLSTTANSTRTIDELDGDTAV